MSTSTYTDAHVLANPYRPLYARWRHPAIINQTTESPTHPLLSRPAFGPLLFHNEQSDVRDHCANERTFLSWLRLSVYMTIVGAAIIVTYHVNSEPGEIEKEAAKPLGTTFGVLALGCLVCGTGTYVRTFEEYGGRRVGRGSGWLTSTIFGIVSGAIIAACILFLVVNA